MQKKIFIKLHRFSCMNNTWPPNRQCLFNAVLKSTIRQANIPLVAGVGTDSNCFQSSSVSCRHFSMRFSWKHLTDWNWFGCEFDAVWYDHPTQLSQSGLLRGISHATASCLQPECASSDKSVMPVPSPSAPGKTEHRVPPIIAWHATEQ